MKKKWLLIGAGVLLLALLLAFCIWWFTPTVFLKDVNPADVARIEVFNGTTGERFAIENSADIEYIVRKIGDVRLQNKEWEQVDGFAYSLSFWAADGTCIEQFMLNGDDRIRDGYLEYEQMYETEEDPLCFKYIKNLEESQRNYPTQ